ncbi:hypothetical protein Taro_017110 [Colocasia esculenta]|uniref:Protein kinase domain-containing protein n=1 Tax=Colocasia esculenta TaxID=4460 RepID=A0A843UV11_COLES|nr:hypothetical protein [Colocasia esculenta]
MTSLSVLPSVYRQVLEAQQADTELADILQMPDVELEEDSDRNMVVTLRGVATWLLSRRPDPSRLEGHWFKIEVGVPSPLFFFFFFLMLVAGCASGGGGGAVVVVPSTSSVIPLSLYFTLGTKLSSRIRCKGGRCGGSRFGCFWWYKSDLGRTESGVLSFSLFISCSSSTLADRSGARGCFWQFCFWVQLTWCLLLSGRWAWRSSERKGQGFAGCVRTGKSSAGACIECGPSSSAAASPQLFPSSRTHHRSTKQLELETVGTYLSREMMGSFSLSRTYGLSTMTILLDLEVVVPGFVPLQPSGCPVENGRASAAPYTSKLAAPGEDELVAFCSSGFDASSSRLVALHDCGLDVPDGGLVAPPATVGLMPLVIGLLFQLPVTTAIVVVFFLLLLLLFAIFGALTVNAGLSQIEIPAISNVKLYSYKELRHATEDFSSIHKLGEGGYGSVYKGRLKDGKFVAIKVLSSDSRQGSREFLSELATISNIVHENLVKLYGCCVEGNHRILVYNYLANNSLSQTLLGKFQFCISICVSNVVVRSNISKGGLLKQTCLSQSYTSDPQLYFLQRLLST